MKSQAYGITRYILFFMFSLITFLTFPLLSDADMSDYQYNVTSGAKCGTDGILSIEFQRWEPLHKIRVIISKCDGTAFNQDGKIKIYRDGNKWLENTYLEGATRKETFIDPVGSGFSGTHEYYATGGPTSGDEYQTGTVFAQPEYSTSCKILKDGSQWNAVGIWYAFSGGSPDGYGYWDDYLPLGAGNFSFFTEKEAGYTITASHSYTELSETYQFSVPAGQDITVNYIPVSSSPEIYNIYPASGTYILGENISVTWDTNDISSGAGMKISLKRDSYTGSTQNESFRILTTTTPNDGSQSFTIPDNITPANDWRVWIVDADGIAEAANANDTISVVSASSPVISNVRPDSGTYAMGGNVTITWGTTDISPTAGMKISLKRDSYTGSTQNTSFRILTTTNTTPNDGSQTFTIPENITPADDWRVWVVDAAGTATAVHAGGTISIVSAVQPPTVTLQSSTSVTFHVGDQMTIQWDSTWQHHYLLELYKGSASVGTIVLNDPGTEQSYSWTIPASVDGHTINGSDYRVKVAVWNSEGESAGDYSAYLSILPSSVVQYTLDVSLNGASGFGLVSGDGISCPVECSNDFGEGTTVTLTASDSNEYQFVSWTDCDSVSGNRCVVEMDSDSSVMASYAEVEYITYPSLSISGSVILQGDSLQIRGSNIYGDTTLIISGPSGFYEEHQFQATYLGNFVYSFTPDLNTPIGMYKCVAKEDSTGLSSNSATFLVSKSFFNTEIDLVSPPEDRLINLFPLFKTKGIIRVEWEDKMFLDSAYPDNPEDITERAYSYKIFFSVDGGNTWSQKGVVEGFARKNEEIALNYTFKDDYVWDDCRVKVVDNYQTSREKISVSFPNNPIAPSDCLSIEKVWDFSAPIREGNPIGVAADGVSRIYLKLSKKNTDEISDVSVKLSDEDSNSSMRVLGKLMPATIVDRYSGEATDNPQLGLASSINGDQNEYWFWYVAPDDFVGNNSEDIQKRERFVKVTFTVNYHSGLTQTISEKITVMRPPLMFVHGLGGSPSTWYNFRHETKLFKKDNRFIKFFIKLSPSDFFQDNASKIVVDNDGSAAPPRTSFQSAIRYMRQHIKCASNQVDYICHSMGGCVLRTVVQTYQDRFYANNNTYAYQNYAKGFVNKFITLDTPHKGSPLADWLHDLVDEINEKGLAVSGLTKLYNDKPNLLLFNWWTYNGSDDNFKPTGAIEDLRVDGGPLFDPINNIPSHLVVGDFFPIDSNLSPEFLNSLKTFKEYLEFFDKIFSFVYDYSPDTLRNQLKPLKKIADPAEKIVLFINIILAADFIFDSDLIVGVDSQLSGLPEDNPPSHVTVKEWMGHTGIRSVTEDSDIGKKVDLLLNSSTASSFFGDIPSSYRSRTSKFKRSPRKILSRKVITHEDSSKISIITPTAGDNLSVGEKVQINFNLTETADLDYVKVYFQGSSHTDISKSHAYHIEFPIDGDRIGHQKIFIKTVYNHDDITAVELKEISMNVLPSSPATALEVTPMVMDLEIGQEKYPDYKIIFEDFISSGINSNITATVDNPSIVEFNPSTKSFTGLSSGETFATISYQNITTILYFSVSETAPYNFDDTDLSDAIIALQIVAGIKGGNVHIDADVNNDNKIGLEEAIYILQHIAGLHNNTDCSVTIPIPPISDFDSNSGTGFILVATSSPECSWTATSNADWIIINSGSGTGNGSAEFSVSENTTGSQRNGIITIADQAITITQDRKEITDGLVGRWDFDLNIIPNTALDSSGNDNNGTIVGAIYDSGKEGMALNFSGDGNYLQLPRILSDYVTDHFTIALWAKVLGTRTKSYLLHANDDRPGIIVDSSNRLSYYFKPDYTSSPLSGQSPTGSSSSPLEAPASWSHIACTWNGAEFTAYLNGQKIGGKSLPDFQLGDRLLIGSDGNADRSFEGIIDTVLIYDRALSADEIAYLAN